MIEITMAKIKIGPDDYYVVETFLLENEEASIKKVIESSKCPSMYKTEWCQVVNPNMDFLSDLKKMMIKIEKGDPSKYFRGDYGKYYITKYPKIAAFYNMLLEKK